MKATIFLFAGLSAAAIAQPHQHRHNHAKRQAVVTDVEVQTETDVVTATAPNAVVYVDQNGNPTATSFEGQAAPTSTAQQQQNWAPPSSWAAPSADSSSYVAPAPSSYAAPSSSSAAAASSSAPAPSSYSAPASSASSASSAPAPSSSSSSGSGSNSGYAISYSPYHTDNSCKSQDEVNKDIKGISGYSMIRIYGTSCNQASTVLNAARAQGMQLFAGVYDITQVESEVDSIIGAADGDWSGIHTISIGNEGVNDGTYTVDAVLAALTTARGKLSGAGYTGKIVTVDTFVAILANPQLCKASDYAAANCHAFFDNTCTAENAGSYVLKMAQAVSQACGGMDTMITESGWPSQGQSNGQAVPSTENQAAAISSLKSAFSSNLILFNSYNDYWKTSTAAQFGAEQHWGVLGNAPSSS